jgi:hypothetical protein
VQLRTARLCLDCEEIHDAQQCPVCASDDFAFISRWIPAPERRAESRRTPTPPQAAAYQQLLGAEAREPKVARILKQGAFGIAAIGLAGWLWRNRKARDDRQSG